MRFALDINALVATGQWVRDTRLGTGTQGGAVTGRGAVAESLGADGGEGRERGLKKSVGGRVVRVRGEERVDARGPLCSLIPSI